MQIHFPDEERLRKIKVIALDLDGTLLNNSHEISPRTKRVLQEAVVKGYQVLLVSGRSYLSMLPFYKDLGLTTPIIAFQGATMINPQSGEHLLKNYLCEEVARSAISIAEEEGLYLHVYDDQTPVYWGDRTLADKYNRQTASGPVSHKGREINWENCVKAMFMVHTNEIGRLEDLKKDLDSLATWNGKAYTFFSNATYLEVLSVLAGKELALKTFVESSGLSSENVCAFGDAMNDQRMLQEMGIGVAMANGLNELLETTEFITKSNEEEGVADFIERYLLSL